MNNNFANSHDFAKQVSSMSKMNTWAKRQELEEVPRNHPPLGLDKDTSCEAQLNTMAIQKTRGPADQTTPSG